MLDLEFLRENINFTNVSPSASKADIESFCRLALNNRVKTIYVPPIFVDLAVSIVSNRGPGVGTTSGFPYGNIPTELKIDGIKYAAAKGARWVDACLNVSYLKSGEFDKTEHELEQLVAEANENNIGLKVIVDAPYLNNKELIVATKLVDSSGADFLKTATGVGNKISEHHITTIKPHLKNAKLKASGGISTLEEAKLFFDAGVDKIGTSKGFLILEELLQNE